jgi:hypothetical protein
MLGTEARMSHIEPPLKHTLSYSNGFVLLRNDMRPRVEQTSLLPHQLRLRQRYVTLWHASCVGIFNLLQGKKGAKSGKHRAMDSDDWAWTDHIPHTLSMINRVLRDLPTHRLYTTTAERDTFIK